MEAVGSELNLYERPVVQTAIIGESIREYNPKATIIQGSPLDFSISGGAHHYVDLNNAKLEVRVKLTSPTGADIAAGTRVGVANLTLHSLFQGMVMKCNRSTVTESNNLYPYRAMLETIINYQTDVLKTRMICEGYTEDTAGQMDVTNPAGANTGLGTREASFNASRIVRLIGRPHLDLFHQEKLIPPSVTIDIQLIPCRAPFLIKTAAPTSGAEQLLYKFEIVSARFLVPFKQVSDSMFIAHQKMLQEVNYQIPHTKVLMKTQTIPQGVTNFKAANLFTGVCPDRIAMVMVEDAAATGSYLRNPFNFQHFNLNYLTLNVNSQYIPGIPYEPDFARADYLRDYITVMEGLGYDIGPYTWDVTPNEWANGYNIYVFKITPGSIGAVKSLPLTGDVSSELKFSTATTGVITLVILAEQAATLEIDKFNHVLI